MRASWRRWKISKRPKTPHPNVHGYSLVEKSETGDKIDDVFARADHVFEHTFSTAREFQGFIEPRACVVWLDEQQRPPSLFDLRAAVDLVRPVPERIRDAATTVCAA